MGSGYGVRGTGMVSEYGPVPQRCSGIGPGIGVVSKWGPGMVLPECLARVWCSGVSLVCRLFFPNAPECFACFPL